MAENMSENILENADEEVAAQAVEEAVEDTEETEEEEEFSIDESDVLFENRYEMNADYYREIYTYEFFGSAKFMIINLIAAAYLIYNVLATIFVSSAQLVFCFLGVAVWALFILLMVWRYKKVVSLAISRGEELSPGDLSRVLYIIRGDGIVLSSLNSKGRMNKPIRPKITRVKDVGNYYLIHTRSRLIYTFRKDGFAKGSAESFASYLRTRGYRV